MLVLDWLVYLREGERGGEELVGVSLSEAEMVSGRVQLLVPFKTENSSKVETNVTDWVINLCLLVNWFDLLCAGFNSVNGWADEWMNEWMIRGEMQSHLRFAWCGRSFGTARTPGTLAQNLDWMREHADLSPRKREKERKAGSIGVNARCIRNSWDEPGNWQPFLYFSIGNGKQSSDSMQMWSFPSLFVFLFVVVLFLFSSILK